MELSRNKNKYVFEFGSSTIDSCEPETISKWDKLGESDTFKVYCAVKSQRLGYVSTEFSLTKENASNITDEQIKVWADQFTAAMDAAILKYNSKRSKIEHMVNTSRYRVEGWVRSAIDSTKKRLQNDRETVYLNPKKEVVSPSLYSVLSCVTKYDPGTFEDFCADFGYDNDSISALKTYKSVCKEWQKVDLLFGDVIEELQEIQ